MCLQSPGGRRAHRVWQNNGCGEERRLPEGRKRSECSPGAGVCLCLVLGHWVAERRAAVRPSDTGISQASIAASPCY